MLSPVPAHNEAHKRVECGRRASEVGRRGRWADGEGSRKKEENKKKTKVETTASGAFVTADDTRAVGGVYGVHYVQSE